MCIDLRYFTLFYVIVMCSFAVRSVRASADRIPESSANHNLLMQYLLKSVHAGIKEERF